MKALLEEERLLQGKYKLIRHLNRVEWDTIRKSARVATQRGNHLQRLGYRLSGLQYLYAEEVLFMLGRSVLTVSIHGVAVSLQEAYAYLLPYVQNANLASYSSYAYLKRLGFSVLRKVPHPSIIHETPPPNTITSKWQRFINWIYYYKWSSNSALHHSNHSLFNNDTLTTKLNWIISPFKNTTTTPSYSFTTFNTATSTSALMDIESYLNLSTPTTTDPSSSPSLAPSLICSIAHEGTFTYLQIERVV
ncbi:hypothetical protein BDF19DRAFT_473487 [Syncephalis fuscata]|nr:hypothetical protein BDF19DRAFT_473487 [Syncephalis fuscata]